jgi:hypothetical protein
MIESKRDYEPRGAVVVRFLLRALYALFATGVTIALLPAWLLFPVPETVRRIFAASGKWLVTHTPHRVRRSFGLLFDRFARVVEGEEGQSLSGVAITTLYYKYKARQLVLACLVMVIATCALLVGVVICRPTNTAALLYLACLQCGFCVLASLRARLLRYRVSAGLFGSSRHEVREAIGFMVREVDNIDFTGGPGRRLPALLPEELVSRASGRGHPEGVRV